MAQDLTGYRNSLLAQITEEEELQRKLREDVPSVNILNNGVTNQQQSVNILNNTVEPQDSVSNKMKALDIEVETGLGTRLDNVMSDIEKKRYLNSLSEDQYNQMLQYKNEGYGFMASKALLENSHKLADPTAKGLLKYKDYAEKDAYYNNARDINPNTALGKFATWLQNTFDNQTPTEYLANWWNTKYGEKVARGDETYLDRFANMTFGTLVNLLDSGISGAMGIHDKAESRLNAKLDRDILGLETDNKFYRTMDTNLASDISKYVGSALTMAALGKFTAKHPLGMLKFNVLGATKLGEKAIDLTIGNIVRLANWTLDTIPGIRAGYRALDDQGKEALLNVATLGILHGLGKYVSPKVANTKVGNYVGEVRNAVKNSFEQGVKGAAREGRIQAEVEKAAGTKTYDYVDPVTGEKGTFDTFEGYDNRYRTRIAQASARGFREGFWNGIYDNFQNVGGNKGQFARGITPYNPNLQNGGLGGNPVGGPQGDGNSGGGSDNVNGNSNNGGLRNIKRNVGESQLAVWNRMTKGTINKFFRDYGESYTKWLIDRGFTNSYETNIQPLINYAQKVQADKEAVLKTIPTRYVDYRVNDMLKEILKRAEYVKSPDLSKIQNLVLKNSQGGLTLLDTDWIRKWYGDHIKTGFHRENNSEEIERADNIYFRVQEFLEEKAAENGFDELKQLNKEIAAAYHIIIGATEWYNGIQANQYITLKDAIALAGAMSNPKTRPILAFRMMIKNAKVKDAVLKMLLKGKTPKEKKQIKIDFERIIKTVEANKEAEAQKQFEEFMAKWNVDIQPIENALGYDPEVGEFIDYSTPTMVTPEGQSKRYGQILETSKGEIKRPGTTKPAEKIVDSVVNELVKEGVVEEENADIVKENVMDNLSEKATEKLAEVEQKLENGEELMEEEQQIVEKVADTIENNKEDLQAKRIREFNENFEKQVDDKKLDEIREFVNEGGELKIVPIGIRKTVKLKYHSVMLSKAELDILKDEGLITDKDIPERYIEEEPSQQKVDNPDDIKTYGSQYVLDNLYGQSSITDKSGKKVKRVTLKGMGDKLDNDTELDTSKLTLPPEGVDYMDYMMNRGNHHYVIDKNGRVFSVLNGPFDSDIDGFFEGIVEKGQNGVDQDIIEYLETRDTYMKNQGWTLKKTYDKYVEGKKNILSGEAKPGRKQVHKDFVEFIEKKQKQPSTATQPKQDSVAVFKDRTNRLYNPINGETPSELENMVKEWITDRLLNDGGYTEDDFEIVDLAVSGSRARGLERPDSDIDIVVEFDGDRLREDDLFNVLNNEKFEYEGVEVDINPILSDLGEYLEGAEEYLSEKSQQEPKQVKREFKQGTLESTDDLVNKIKEKDMAENPDKYITVETKEIIGTTDTMNELQDKIKNIKSFDDFGEIFTKVEDPLNLSAMYGPGKEQYKDAYYYGKLGGKDIVIKRYAPHDRGTLNIGQGAEMSYGRPILSEIERATDNPITLEQIKAKLLNADDETIKNIGQIKKSDYNTDNLQPNTTTNGYNGNSGEANQGQDKLSDNEQVLQLNDGGAEGVMEEISTKGSTKTLNKRSNDSIKGGSGPSNATSTRSIWTKGDNVITSKTTTQARDINRDAVKILEDHNYSTNANDYTEAEKDILRQYEGRGGINDKTDTNTQGALNQYYTKDNIIKAMWRLVNKYNNADILEPSMGTGRFFMYAPEGSNLYGFEYDKIPGTIAKILYPNANIVIGDFQQNFMVGKRSVGDMYTGRKYDLVIGNPPYEDRGGTYMGLGEEPKIGRFDDYFIKRGIDMLKPGGHLIYVTSSQFLRGGNNYAKDKISEKAQLIDAYRIPINAFDRTGVETDIILLERTEDGGDVNLLSASKWFDQHPEKILGTERNDVKGRFGNITAVVGDLAGIDEIGMDNVEKNTEIEILEEYKPMDTTEKEQRQIVRDSIKNAEGDKVTFIKKEIAAIPTLVKELSKLPNQKDTIEAMNIQLDEYKKQLAKLEPQTQEAKFIPNEPKQETPIEYKNLNLKPKKASSKPKTKRKEIITGEWTDWTETREGDNGETETIVWGKSYKGVLYKGKENTPTGKLIIGKGGIGKYQNVLNSNGKIGDPNITLESDKEGLNYINGELEPNILYASGYLPKKLEILEEDYSKGNIDERQYNKQKKLLLDAMPEPIPFRDIYWSPYTEWILNMETNILKDEYDIEEHAYVEKPQTIKQLFVKRVKDRKDELGTVTVIRKDSKTGMPKPPVEESLAEGIINALYGNKLADEMKEALTTKMPQYFDEFMKGGSVDELTKQQMEEEFNRKYNSTAIFDYGDLGYTIDNVALNFKGGEFKPSDIQARGVSRILTTESMIIAHGVGQGKTIEGVDGAIASMQQGKATKALIVVPGGTKAERMQTIAMRAPTQEIVDLGTLSVGSGTRDRLADAFGPDPRNWIQPGQIAILEHSAVGRQISFKEDTLAMLQDKLTDVTNQPFSRETELHKIEKELNKLKEENQDYYISNSQLEKNKKKIEKLEGQLESTQSTTEVLGKTIARYTEKGLDDEGITTALGYLTDSYDDYLSKMEEYINNNYSEQKDREKAIKVANKIFVNERPIYLEDLGIDHITVDEAHNFRNLFNKAIQEDEEGNGNWRASIDTEKGSGEAMTLYGMTQYIMDINGGGNVILLTATPFINNPSEVYNMLSYVGKNGMEEMGVSSIDDFFDTFVGLTSKMTSNASGTDMKRKSVMVKFNNTQALIQSLLDRYIDYEGESETIVKPRLNTYVARLELSPLQKEIEEKLEVQIEEGEFDDNWRGEPIMVKDPKTKEMVSLDSTRKRNDRGETQGGVLEGMTQANSNLVSPYLTKYLKNKLPDLTPAKLIETSPKLQFVVDYIKTQRDSGILRGVFVYMPVGVELHELFKQAIEDTIPGIRVGIINGNTKYKDLTDKQAEALGLGEGKGAKARQTGKRFHDGELDVLIGGESTKEGLNLQGNGYVTIEVSQPRNANDRIQLLGRVDRQGNLSNEVIDLVLLMENSSDIYRYELLGRKNSRWSLLEMLAAYKRGEEIADVVPQSDLNFEEQQLALFTEPERKAKISIFIDKETLQEELNKIRGRIAGGENIMNIISQRDNYRGVYKEFPSERDLKDENGNIVSVDIFSDKALEPLEQLVKFRYEQAVETARKYNPNLNKAEIDKMIRKNSPRRYEFSQYNEAKISLNQAKGDRDSVLRQMDVIGLKSKEELQNYLTKLHDDELVVREKINNIEKTKDERVAEYRRIKEENEKNVMRIDDIIVDLMEEFGHQLTLGSKLELRNWLKVTQNLPKRKQAESKEDIRLGRNKYEWKSEDYVGIEPEEGTVVMNKIPSNWSEYSETNIKPEFDFKGFIPKATIKKEDGTMLTKFGYQSQLRQGYKNILAEEKQQTQEELEKDQYYQTLVSRAKNNVLKFAKRYYNEIIEAFEKERPNQRGSTNPDNFKDYINDYTIEKGVVDKIRDDIVQEGAEYIAERYADYLTGEE